MNVFAALSLSVGRIVSAARRFHNLAATVQQARRVHSRAGKLTQFTDGRTMRDAYALQAIRKSDPLAGSILTGNKGLATGNACNRLDLDLHARDGKRADTDQGTRWSNVAEVPSPDRIDKRPVSDIG
jgi:hypothetical protein